MPRAERGRCEARDAPPGPPEVGRAPDYEIFPVGMNEARPMSARGGAGAAARRLGGRRYGLSFALPDTVTMHPGKPENPFSVPEMRIDLVVLEMLVGEIVRSKGAE